jgi:ribonuclease T1
MMSTQRIVIRLAILLLFICLSPIAPAQAASCEKVISAVNAQLPSKIDQQELIDMLRSLDHTNNKKLPPKFVTKYKARSQGWKPGENLWSIDGLRGSSIGGDPFKNMEGRLPGNKWREADLDYKGGHRGGKRLIFSRDGKRFMTVDHYRTFVEIPACQ